MRSLPVAANDRIALLGPDWATPGLLDAVRGVGAIVAGIYTADTRQVDTMGWGHRVRALEQLGGSDASLLVGASRAEACADRIARSGFPGRVAWLSPGSSTSVLEPSVERRLWQAGHADAVARGDLAGAAECLAALAILSGPGRAQHTYDAAMAWDAQGRSDEALRLFESVAAGDEVEASLRSRARFHAGRLLVERGDLAGARRHLAQVLREVPDHRRARAYLEGLEAARAATDRRDERRANPAGRPRRSAKRRPPTRA
jgi:hypothetical protein